LIYEQNYYTSRWSEGYEESPNRERRKFSLGFPDKNK